MVSSACVLETRDVGDADVVLSFARQEGYRSSFDTSAVFDDEALSFMLTLRGEN